MSATNQCFDVACRFEDLASVIALGVELAGWKEPMTRYDHRVRPAFQVTDDGLYCLGVGTMHAVGKSTPCAGWTDFPFDYDPAILSPVVAQWVRAHPKPAPSGTDGTEVLGVRVRGVPSLDPGRCGRIRDPLNCVLAFEPFHLGYDK